MSDAASTTERASIDAQQALGQGEEARQQSPYQAVWSALPAHKGRPPEVSLGDSVSERAVPPQIRSRVTAEFREVEDFLTLASDAEHLQAQVAKLKREMEAARSEAAEEREARKAAEERALVLRLRLAEHGGAERGPREAPEAPEGGGAAAAAAAAAAQGVQR